MEVRRIGKGINRIIMSDEILKTVVVIMEL